MARKTTAARGFCRAPRLTRLALALLLAGLSATYAMPTLASDYLTGKSYDLAKCARAVLHRYRVEHVRVHGHHFHCDPMRNTGAIRVVHLTHNRRLGEDDELWFSFRTDSLGRYVTGSLETDLTPGRIKLPEITKKRLLLFLGHPEAYLWNTFKGRPAPRSTPTYADYLKRTNTLKRNTVRDDWQDAANDIFAGIVAELGNPQNRGTIRRQADCKLPIFYEHDNFRGRAHKLSASNLHKLVVKGADMGDRISSLCVPRGWTATVYEDDHFKGASRTFTGPLEFEDLERRGGLHWGDRISSIRVTRR